MTVLSISSEADDILWQKIRAGDEQALQVLFKRYYAALVRFAKNIVKETADAEDIVQAVFIKLWEGRQERAIHSGIKAYLYMAVKNTCFNKLKQNEKNFFMDDTLEDDERLSSNSTIDYIAAKTLEKKIELAMEQLPPKCGLIFKLSRFEEKSYKEIAAILDISVKTVENQMGKALMLMRSALKDHITVVLALAGYLSGKFF